MYKKITISNIEDFIYLFNNNNNFRDIKSVEPIFIGMLKAYQEEKELTIQTNNDYIKNMIFQEYKENATYSPIEHIPNSRIGLEKISTHLTDIMLKNFSALSKTDITDLKHYLQYLFLELMNNVADHANSPIGGYTMAQYYPKEKKIQFVVADRGVAFLKNIQLNFPNIDNEEQAIFKALEKGITSTETKVYGDTTKNAGFGLYAMSKILDMTGGKFIIISNNTLVRYENGEFSTKQLNSTWKGVVVSFEFFEANINHNMDYFKRNYLWKIDEKDDDFF